MRVSTDKNTASPCREHAEIIYTNMISQGDSCYSVERCAIRNPHVITDGFKAHFFDRLAAKERHLRFLE